MNTWESLGCELPRPQSLSEQGPACSILGVIAYRLSPPTLRIHHRFSQIPARSNSGGALCASDLVEERVEEVLDEKDGLSKKSKSLGERKEQLKERDGRKKDWNSRPFPCIEGSWPRCNRTTTSWYGTSTGWRRTQKRALFFFLSYRF